MSSIQTDVIAFDTNEYVFAVRHAIEHTHYLDSYNLVFERIAGLRVFIPREVVRELRRNLIPREFQAVLAQLQRAAEVIWDFEPPPADLVRHYQSLGAKKGDSVIASHLHASRVQILVSENRHFLVEISNLPFRVLTAADFLNVIK